MNLFVAWLCFCTITWYDVTTRIDAVQLVRTHGRQRNRVDDTPPPSPPPPPTTCLAGQYVVNYPQFPPICQNCTRGTYSDTNMAMSCTPCPFGFMTVSEGSNSATNCIPINCNQYEGYGGIGPACQCSVGWYNKTIIGFDNNFRPTGCIPMNCTSPGFILKTIPPTGWHMCYCDWDSGYFGTIRYLPGRIDPNSCQLVQCSFNWMPNQDINDPARNFPINTTVTPQCTFPGQYYGKQLTCGFWKDAIGQPFPVLTHDQRILEDRVSTHVINGWVSGASYNLNDHYWNEPGNRVTSNVNINYPRCSI